MQGFLQNLSCQKPCWDQPRLSCMVVLVVFIADPIIANSTTDTDTLPFRDIDDTLSTFSLWMYIQI